MANGTTPPGTTPPVIAAPTQADIDKWNQYNAQLENADTDLSKVSFSGDLVSKAFSAVDEMLGKVGTRLGNIGNLTDTQATKFGILTAATFGAQKSFESFSNVDTTRLSAFTDQLDQLSNTIAQAPAGKFAKDLEEWGTKMKHAGFNAGIVDRAVSELGTGVTATAKAILMSADNNLRLQNSFMQLSAQMGDTDTLFSEMSKTVGGVGKDLENLNSITAKYQDVMTSAMQATGITNRETMYQFASQINQLPGGFKELIVGMELGGRQTNLLTATIQSATGSGRQLSEVIQDMKQAMLEYGISGSSALEFTANITTVANKFHAQIADVRSALMDSVSAFKFFATGESDVTQMTQGMAESMNQYVGSLRAIGVPAQNALDMFKNYQSQLKGMTQAQEAFISAQSGGPGGLRGGFQIDAMIRRGDFAGLQKKVEDTIRKMTGPIVSFEDAQRSESAAAQYTRQIQILQQGPLGSMARTRAEAESLLEAMKKGTGIAAIKRPDEALKDSIERGTKIEQLSYTKLSEINTNIIRMQNVGGVANLTTVQRALAAGTGAGGGVAGTGAGLPVAARADLRAAQERGIHPAEMSASQRAFSEAGDTIKTFHESVSGAVDSIHESISGPRAVTPRADYVPAGRQVGGAIPATAAGGGVRHTAGAAPTVGGPVAGAGAPVPVVLAPGSAISVNFTGVCPHCGRDVHTTEVGRTVSPQALTGPGF